MFVSENETKNTTNLWHYRNKTLLNNASIDKKKKKKKSLTKHWLIEGMWKITGWYKYLINFALKKNSLSSTFHRNNVWVILISFFKSCPSVSLWRNERINCKEYLRYICFTGKKTQKFWDCYKIDISHQKVYIKTNVIKDSNLHCLSLWQNRWKVSWNDKTTFAIAIWVSSIININATWTLQQNLHINMIALCTNFFEYSQIAL